MKKLHEWFLNEKNQEYRDDYFLDEERCLELYLFEKRKNRKLAGEIMSILCTWEPYYLYEFLLDSMEKFLTNEEIRKLKERRYRIWLQENKIISLKDIYEWFTKRFERGVLVSRSGSEGREAYEHLEQFLEEMPLTRESAEIILKYSEYFPTDELTYILSTRFRHFLTKEEIAEYLYE